MSRAEHQNILERLSKEAQDITLKIYAHEHAVDKLNALIDALQIAQIIPKIVRIAC